MEWQKKKISLNNRHLFLPVLKFEESKIKVPADSVLDENPLPTAVSSHSMENTQVSSSSSKGPNLIMGAPRS